MIPGHAERLTRAERVPKGVPIDDETWRELSAAARTINVLIEPPRSKSEQGSPSGKPSRNLPLQKLEFLRRFRPRPVIEAAARNLEERALPAYGLRRFRLFGQLPGRNKLKAGSRLLV